MPVYLYDPLDVRRRAIGVGARADEIKSFISRDIDIPAPVLGVRIRYFRTPGARVNDNTAREWARRRQEVGTSAPFDDG
jgi:hypothetical protein